MTEAVKLDPYFDPAVLLYAELKIRKGSPAAAVDALLPLMKERPQTVSLTQLTNNRPQVSQAHYLLATAYLAQQKNDEALAVYRRMRELFPQDPQPSFLIGNILLAQNQRPEARKAFEIGRDLSRLPAAGGEIGRSRSC